jgi:hypothetical protein
MRELLFVVNVAAAAAAAAAPQLALQYDAPI